MFKKIALVGVELTLLLFLAVIGLIWFSGGFSLALGPVLIKAHSLKNPLLILLTALCLRKCLLSAFFRESVWLPPIGRIKVALQTVADKIARRFLAARRFRRKVLWGLLLLLVSAILAAVVNPLDYGLNAVYYDNVSGSGAPILTAREDAFDLRRMGQKFPNIRTNYSIAWSGLIFIPIAGDYQFATRSDDGSELSVDDRRVVDNSGFHGLQERTGRLHLARGFHALDIRYVQGSSAAEFRAYWTPPGKPREDLAQATLLANAPTARMFFVGRGLEIVGAASAWLLTLGLVSGALVSARSSRILAPFFRASLIGRACRRGWDWLFKDHVPPRAFPAPAQKSTAAGLLALTGYVLLSLVWTYPLLLNFSTKMIGIGGDRYIALWNMWWMKKALLDLHVNPLYTDYLFYPHGLSLAFHDYSIFDSLASVPLQAFFTLPEIYNLLFLASYILGGCGCFLLVSYLTGDRYAAFLSGLVFAFWGGRAFYSDHLSFATIQWFPFCALYLLKTLRETAYRNPLLAAAFLAINAYSCGYYAIYMALFTALFLGYFACAESRTFFAAACLKRFGLAGLLFGSLMAPLAYPMLKDVLSGANYMVSALLSTEATSLNTLLFPSVNHPFIGKYVRYLYLKADLPMQWGLTGASFFGYTVLGLCVYTAVKLRHLKQGFWLLATTVFVVLAMGPHVLLFSQEYSWLPLPYLLLRRIPILGMVRVPVRFMILAMCCASVVAGLACWDIFRRLRIKKMAFVILAAALLFESFRGVGVTPLETAPAFYNQLARDREDYAILELTKLMNWEHSAARASLFQLTHGKRLFHGHVSRVSFDTYHQAYALYSVFDDLLACPPAQCTAAVGQNLFGGIDKPAITALLAFYKVRYVTLYYDYWYGSYENNRAILRQVFGEPVWEENGVSIFPVAQTPLAKNLAFPGFGMFPLAFDDAGGAIRAAARSADIKLLSVAPGQHVQVRFQGRSARFPQTERLRLFLNETLLTTVAIGDWTEVTLPAAALRPGENTLKFRLLDADAANWKQGLLLRQLEVEYL